MHISLVNFKLRHICFFNTEIYEIKRKSSFFRNDGSGKTSIGSIVSKKLNLDFIDVDQEIEKNLGINISKLFETKGEKYFREIEEKITLKLLKKESTVISLGGGAFLNKNIKKEILEKHISFWLNWKAQTLIERIKNNKKRPLAYKIGKMNCLNL